MKLLKFLFLGGLLAVVLFTITRLLIKLSVDVEIVASVFTIIWIIVIYRMVMKLEPPSLNTYKREKAKV